MERAPRQRWRPLLVLTVDFADRFERHRRPMIRKLLAAALAVSLGAFGALAAPTNGYEETTTVAGKIPVDLRGAWFLVAQPEVAKDKFKTFVELLTISKQKDGQLAFHLLDVRLPPDIAAELKAANSDLTHWTPSPEELATLRKGWSKLPPATDKDPVAGDVAYARIQFRLASPERYAEVFTKQDAAVKGVLSDSTFTLEVVEQYRALPISPEQRIVQLMQRTTIYGFRGAGGDHLLEGAQVIGFLAAHPLAPIPLNWSGKFTMYRLASAKEVGGAPAARGKSRRPSGKTPPEHKP